MVGISTKIFQVSIFRLITRIGICAEIVIATAYIGEIALKSKRGRYTSCIFPIGSIGFVASGPVLFVLLQQYKIMGIEGWRVLMAIRGVVALLLFLLRYGMLESPHWISSKGKIKEARLLFMKLCLPPDSCATVSSLSYLAVIMADLILIFLLPYFNIGACLSF